MIKLLRNKCNGRTSSSPHKLKFAGTLLRGKRRKDDLSATGLEEYGMASDLRSRAGGGLAGTKRPQVEEQKIADPDIVTAVDFRQARSPQAGQ